MGTIFEPFIIAFWVAIATFVGIFLWVVASLIIRGLKDNDKKDKED